LVAGERDEHLALEKEVAEWVGLPSALAFTSGYTANLGAVTSLVGPEDLVVSDELIHASLIDGARLSRARIEVVPHRDVDAVERALRRRKEARALVLTEAYFSMDADTPDLRALRKVCDRHDAALLVDEAHSLGVFGPDGRGLCAQAGIVPDVFIGTFGKALGGAGAFVAGSRDLTAWLWNRARPFVFSTGMSPALAAGVLTNIRFLRAQAGLRSDLMRAAQHFRGGLRSFGLDPLGTGPIIPWVVGDARRAVLLARGLSSRGVHVHAIRPPSVPDGTARIRFTVTARHNDEDIERALGALRGLLIAEEPVTSVANDSPFPGAEKTDVIPAISLDDAEAVLTADDRREPHDD
jgi:8-amino-7-oxononanoate synthase